MRLVWSDEPPQNFNWAPVRATVLKLVTAVGSGKAVGDVIQSATGGSTCSTRALGPMGKAWNADVVSLSIRTDTGKALWPNKQLAKVQVDNVHRRAEDGRRQDSKVKVTALSFSISDAKNDHSRFKSSFHCVWAIDGGEDTNTGRLYFVVYDQDVTCTQNGNDAWDRACAECGGRSEKEVDGLGLDDPDAKLLVRKMLLGGRDEGPLAPLIRFLYIVE